MCDTKFCYVKYVENKYISGTKFVIKSINKKNRTLIGESLTEKCERTICFNEIMWGSKTHAINFEGMPTGWIISSVVVDNSVMELYVDTYVGNCLYAKKSSTSGGYSFKPILIDINKIFFQTGPDTYVRYPPKCATFIFNDIISSITSRGIQIIDCSVESSARNNNSKHFLQSDALHNQINEHSKPQLSGHKRKNDEMATEFSETKRQKILPDNKFITQKNTNESCIENKYLSPKEWIEELLKQSENPDDIDLNEI